MPGRRLSGLSGYGLVPLAAVNPDAVHVVLLRR